MIAKNPELEDSPNFIFNVTTHFQRTENQKPNVFCVRGLKLLDNGWVVVTEHDDTPPSVYPPWRIIVLEGIDCD